MRLPQIICLRPCVTVVAFSYSLYCPYLFSYVLPGPPLLETSRVAFRVPIRRRYFLISSRPPVICSVDGAAPCTYLLKIENFSCLLPNEMLLTFHRFSVNNFYFIITEIRRHFFYIYIFKYEGIAYV